MRTLATIETITDIAPIPDADMIEVATIRGWKVVVKKDEMTVGDPVVFFEIDTMLNVEDPRFEFLAGRGIRTDTDGRTGHVLRTMRMRGQYSQGLAIPIEMFPELLALHPNDVSDTAIADLIGVWKWEPPIPASLAGVSRGGMPTWCWKTDAERVQNLARSDVFPMTSDWYATEKIDGQSCTMTLRDGDFHVASRNVDMVETQGNTMWELARDHKVEEFLRRMTSGVDVDSVTVQGEVYGEGIQQNRLNMKGHHLAVFNFAVDGEDVPPANWPDFDAAGIPMVRFLPDLPPPVSLEAAIQQVEGMESVTAPGRQAEGVVWRHRDSQLRLDGGHRAVKAINNRYLAKAK